MKSLFFDYPDTARIRIKRENVWENPHLPLIYRIKTKKMDFLVPRAAVIVGPVYVYIPNSVYKEAYNKYIMLVSKQ